jgi:hypothetical protein
MPDFKAIPRGISFYLYCMYHCVNLISKCNLEQENPYSFRQQSTHYSMNYIYHLSERVPGAPMIKAFE